MRTPLDPEARENQSVINMALVTQSSTNIRQTFQQLQDFAEMNNSQLLKAANEVSENREQKATGVSNCVLVKSCNAEPRPRTTDRGALTKERNQNETSTSPRPTRLLQRDWLLEKRVP